MNFVHENPCIPYALNSKEMVALPGSELVAAAYRHT